MSYYIARENFETLVVKCVQTSRTLENICSKSQQHYYASVLFTKMCVIAKTLLSILPERESGHWDYSSIASLTRNIIECYLVFYYLCIDKPSKTEWGCRWNIFNLHDCKARISLQEKAGMQAEVDELKKLVTDLEKRLKKNKYFTSLPVNQQKEYLKGKKPFLVSQDVLVAKIGLDKETFRFYYEFLSSQTHSFPLGFYGMRGDGRGRGVHCQVEENHSKVIINYCINFLEQAEKDMNFLFGESE